MTKHLDIDTKAMRAKILDLAIRGKLTDQQQEDGSARDLLKAIQAEKEKLIKEKKIKKEKPLPEITEEEKPYEIPNSWEWVRLRDISSKIVDGTHHSPPNQITGAYMYVTAKNIKSDGVHLDNITYVSENVHKEIYSRCNPEMGDILYIKDGATTGIVTINNIKQEYSLLSSVALIKTFDAIYNSYIVYALRNPVFYGSVRDKMTGTGITRITLRVLSTLLIPLPPLAEQKRIADKVSALFAQLDVIDKAYEEYRELQQVMKSKLLELAIQGKLTDQREEDGNARDLLKEIQAEKEKLIKEKKIKKEKPLPEITEEEKPFEIPNSWEWVRWGTLSTSIKYGYNTSAQKDGKIKMVRISDIQNNQVNWDSVPFCNIPHEEITQYLLRKNDILFARTGGTVGKSYLVSEVPENVVYAGYLIRTRYSEKLSPQYLKYFMESYLYWSQLKKGTTITAQPNCNAKTLEKMVLPLPPLAEQQRIVAKLDELLPLL